MERPDGTGRRGSGKEKYAGRPVRENGTRSTGFQLRRKDTRNSQMLENLLPEEFPLSKQAVTLDGMSSKRELYTGYGEVQTKKTDGGCMIACCLMNIC